MAVTLTVRRRRAPQSRITAADQDNLEVTDQHGPGRHALNPHISADAVMPDMSQNVRTKKVDYVPTGKVKWYDKEKGFGFLAGEDGQEVFLPKSSLPEGITELKAGTRVEFGVADGRKGAQALGLRVLDKTPSIAKAKASQRQGPRSAGPGPRDGPGQPVGNPVRGQVPGGQQGQGHRRRPA